VSERVFQLKYRIPTSKEFFETFSKRFMSAKLPPWDETVPWTKLVLKGMLYEMGEEFGFEPVEEYLNLDQMWPMLVERQINTMAVAIEHEASVDEWEGVIYDEGDKLQDVKARLKVLVFYPDLNKWEKAVKGWSSEIKTQELRLPEERYLLIGICADKENEQLILKGAEISNEGQISLKLSDVKVPYAQF
jgi:hypothetical protein